MWRLDAHAQLEHRLREARNLLCRLSLSCKAREVIESCEQVQYNMCTTTVHACAACTACLAPPHPPVPWLAAARAGRRAAWALGSRSGRAAGCGTPQSPDHACRSAAPGPAMAGELTSGRMGQPTKVKEPDRNANTPPQPAQSRSTHRTQLHSIGTSMRGESPHSGGSCREQWQPHARGRPPRPRDGRCPIQQGGHG